jgi:hypothetical protein
MSPGFLAISKPSGKVPVAAGIHPVDVKSHDYASIMPVFGTLKAGRQTK